MFVGLDGRGQVSWILEDGTEAYVRARGLNVDELVAVADAPKPRPATAPIASFDLPDTAPASFGLIAEHTAPWTIKNASVAAAQPAASTCVSVSSQPQPPSGMGSGSIWGSLPTSTTRHLPRLGALTRCTDRRGSTRARMNNQR